MKEENIVRYTAEELRAKKSETDWEKVDSITDEELERLIAEDPENEGTYTVPGIYMGVSSEKRQITIPSTSHQLQHDLLRL